MAIAIQVSGCQLQQRTAWSECEQTREIDMLYNSMSLTIIITTRRIQCYSVYTTSNNAPAFRYIYK